MSDVVDIRVVEEGDGYVVEAEGELDLACVGSLSSAVRAVRAAHAVEGESLIVDMSEVTFLDSEGLKVLLAARRTWGATRGAVVLRRPSPPVVATLSLAGMLEAFTVDADGSMSRPGHDAARWRPA